MPVAAFWALVFGVVAGVALRSLVPFGWWTILFFLISAAILLAFGVLMRSLWHRSLVVVIFLIAVAAGSARMHISVLESEPALQVWVGESVFLEGIVSDEPDQRENTVRLTVTVTSVASTTVASGMRVLVVAPLHTNVAYGDLIRAEGQLRLPEAFDTGLGHAFNYPAFLAKDGIGYELSFARVHVVGNGPRSSLKAGAIWIKQKYLEGLSFALPEPEAGLAGGITAGDKRGLGSDLSETFRIVGLIHIVVLSGYNIMVVIQFLEKLLGGARVWVRSFLAVSIAIFFALITGLASSSVRAASMAVIATVGKATGRTYLAARALGVVALGMLLWNPFLLLFDPGFQLSILATLGLVFIAPLFAIKLSWLTEKFQVREIAAATLGTQTAVLPLILYQSGTLSIFSLPANLFSLIVVPYAMLVSFIAGVAGFFFGSAAPLIGFPAYLLLWYIISVAEFFAQLPFASVTIPAFSPLLLVGLYGLLGFLVSAYQKKTAERDAPPFVKRSA